MADETTLATMNDTVPAAEIADFVKTYPYAHDIVDALLDEVGVPTGTGGSYTVPRFNAWAVPAGTKTEVSAFSRAALSTDGVTIASGVVGGEILLSREVQHDSRAGLPRAAIEQALKAMRQRKLADALALVTGCGATSDAYDDQVFGVATIMAALRVAEDMSLVGPLAIVISPYQAQSLRTDLASEGMLLEASGIASTLFAGHAGFIGSVFGLAVFVSPLIVDDGEGEHALLFSTAPGNRPITCAVWDDLHSEALPRPDIYSDQHFVMERRGMALSLGSEASPAANCVEALSVSAA